MLDEPELPDEHRRFLDVVDRNADRLLRLVSDLLRLPVAGPTAESVGSPDRWAESVL